MIASLGLVYLLGCFATYNVARRDFIYMCEIGLIKDIPRVVVHAIVSAVCMLLWPIALPMYILTMKPFGKLK